MEQNGAVGAIRISVKIETAVYSGVMFLRLVIKNRSVTFCEGYLMYLRQTLVYRPEDATLGTTCVHV